MPEPSPTTLTFVPAATVVVFRTADADNPPELLMVQRSTAMRFAGGAAVFPGGRIDSADYELASRIAPTACPQLAAAKVAAIRETLEETGLAIAIAQPVTLVEAVAARSALLAQGALEPVLEQFGWTLLFDTLVPFAHWCPQWDGAFDTRFFLYDLGTGAVEVAVDATENTRLFWASASDVLALADASEVKVIFPTRRNLERLAPFASFPEARRHAETTPIRVISPRQEQRDGALHLTIPEGLGYPVTAERLDTVKRG